MKAIYFPAISFFFVVLSTKVFLERPVKQPVNDWKEIAASNPDQNLTVLLAVKQQNTDVLIDKLFAVSDPKNDEYGNFMTTQEVRDLLKPSNQATINIENWLSVELGINTLKKEKKNGDMISFVTTIKKLEKLLDTKYYDYKNMKNGKIISRIKMGMDYYVPYYIKSHLDFISPTHRFPVYSTLKKSIGIRQANPTLLRKLYKTGDTNGKSMKNSVAIASFNSEYYDPADLQTMWKYYNTTPCNVTNVPRIQPPLYDLNCEIDTQYMSSMAQAVPMTVWYTGDYNFSNALMEWSKNVLNTANPPLLFSVSYFGIESFYGSSFIARYNTELASMGTAGISVFFASGDSGAGGDCSKPPFEPEYPASSPYVTAVGASTGGTPGATPTGETSWFYGGGGFSNYSPIQSYQSNAVTAYLSNCSMSFPPENYYNKSGRAYPDISAQSVNFEIIIHGGKDFVDGTLCSTPTIGGIFGLINDMRLQNGMKQLGFANPFIYQIFASNSNAFNDITIGYNKGCDLETGFKACTGFDAVSGVGTPDYSKLVSEAMKVGEKTKKYF